jgi:hypothetical protein
MRRESLLSSHCSLWGILMSSLILKFESKQKVAQYSLAPIQICGFSVVLISSFSSARNLTFWSPLAKEWVGSSSWAVSLLILLPLGCLKLLIKFSWSVSASANAVQPPRLTPWEPVDSSPMVPLGFLDSFWPSSVTVHAVQPPWLSRETSYLSWLEPHGPS